MPTIAGRLLTYDEIAALLDAPMLFGGPDDEGTHVVYLNPESAARATGSAVEFAVDTLWSMLRRVPVGRALVIDPGTDEEIRFGGDEIDEVLGVTDRAAASVLSRRRRAELASAWALFRKRADGSPEPTTVDRNGRQWAWCWMDQTAATASLAPGLELMQAPLAGPLRDNPEVAFVIDPNLPGQVVIDAKLRAEILEATQHFPRGYLATVAAFTDDVLTEYTPAMAAVAARMRELEAPVGHLWCVGYRLERAQDQVLAVVDTTPEAWPLLVPEMGRAVAAGRPPGRRPIASLRLDQVPESFHGIVSATPDFMSGP